MEPIINSIITPPLTPQKTANPPPGAFPVPDRQGPYGICTVHALAKAILSGFWRGKFYHGVPVDLNQEAVIAVLLNEFKDLSPRHPTDFDQKNYLFQDVDKTAWKTVIRVQKTDIRVELFPWNLNIFEYLITYWDDAQQFHCVLMDRYDLQSKSFVCINSQGSHLPYLSVPVSAVVDMYRVLCQASPQGALGQTSSQSASSLPVVRGPPPPPTLDALPRDGAGFRAVSCPLPSLGVPGRVPRTFGLGT